MAHRQIDSSMRAWECRRVWVHMNLSLVGLPSSRVVLDVGFSCQIAGISSDAPAVKEFRPAFLDLDWLREASPGLKLAPPGFHSSVNRAQPCLDWALLSRISAHSKMYAIQAEIPWSSLHGSVGCCAAKPSETCLLYGQACNLEIVCDTLTPDTCLQRRQLRTS